MLYCPTCGRWQDVRLAQALSTFVDNLAKAFDQQPPEQLGYPCPAGHGLMMQILPTDRITLRLEQREADARTLVLVRSQDQQEGEESADG